MTQTLSRVLTGSIIESSISLERDQEYGYVVRYEGVQEPSERIEMRGEGAIAGFRRLKANRKRIGKGGGPVPGSRRMGPAGLLRQEVLRQAHDDEGLLMQEIPRRARNDGRPAGFAEARGSCG